MLYIYVCMPICMLCGVSWSTAMMICIHLSVFVLSFFDVVRPRHKPTVLSGSELSLHSYDASGLSTSFTNVGSFSNSAQQLLAEDIDGDGDLDAIVVSGTNIDHYPTEGRFQCRLLVLCRKVGYACV